LKQIAAILFFCVLLFNLFGYRVFIDYLQNREAQEPCTPFNNNINDQDLVSIKVATVLPPYSENSKTFEWIDGEVTVNGIIYQYVKRRIFNDSIEYLCIPDVSKMRFQLAKADFFKLSNDLINSSTHKKTSNSAQIKPVFFEFFSTSGTVSLSPVEDPEKVFPAYNFLFRQTSFVSSLDHPPQSVKG
jgi:hypothetical protein